MSDAVSSEAIQTYQRVMDQQRRDELILSHLPLVKHVLGRLIGELPPGVDVENLEQAGVLGLVEAAGKFDPTRNAQFKTFPEWAKAIIVVPIWAIARAAAIMKKPD